MNNDEYIYIYVYVYVYIYAAFCLLESYQVNEVDRPAHELVQTITVTTFHQSPFWEIVQDCAEPNIFQPDGMLNVHFCQP